MTKTDWSALVRIADAKFKHETRALDALNMRTADLNARKSALRHLAGQAREELPKVKKAFGRKLACDSLLEMTQKKRR